MVRTCPERFRLTLFISLICSRFRLIGISLGELYHWNGLRLRISPTLKSITITWLEQSPNLGGVSKIWYVLRLVAICSLETFLRRSVVCVRSKGFLPLTTSWRDPSRRRLANWKTWVRIQKCWMDAAVVSHFCPLSTLHVGSYVAAFMFRCWKCTLVIPQMVFTEQSHRSLAIWSTSKSSGSTKINSRDPFLLHSVNSVNFPICADITMPYLVVSRNNFTRWPRWIGWNWKTTSWQVPLAHWLEISTFCRYLTLATMPCRGPSRHNSELCSVSKRWNSKGTSSMDRYQRLSAISFCRFWRRTVPPRMVLENQKYIVRKDAARSVVIMPQVSVFITRCS